MHIFWGFCLVFLGPRGFPSRKAERMKSYKHEGNQGSFKAQSGKPREGLPLSWRKSGAAAPPCVLGGGSHQPWVRKPASEAAQGPSHTDY